MSPPPVALRTSIARPRWLAGEPLVLSVEVANLDERQAVSVPSSFDPATDGVRMLVRGAPGTPLVVLDVPSPVGCPMVQLAPGATQEREVSLHRWHAFTPGAYTVTLEWTRFGAAPIVSTVAFEVVAVTAMSFAFTPMTGGEAVDMLAGTAAMSGIGFGVVLPRIFSADIEDPARFSAIADGARFTGDRAVLGIVPVRAAEAPRGWVVWRDAAGLVARAGDAVEGAACSPWPVDDGGLVVGPAEETPAGDLRAWTVRGAPGAQHLVETVFAAPVVTVEAPVGPDDWDDEVLVAGPVSERAIAHFGEATVVAAEHVRRDEGHAQLVVIAADAGGVMLQGAEVDDAEVRWTFRAVLPALPMRGASLAKYVGADGETWVAMALASPDPVHAEVVWSRVIVARIDDAGTHTVQDLWLGALASAPVSAALAFSWVDAERPFWRLLVACEDGSAWLGDADARWSSLDGADLVQPVSLATCRDHAHAAVRGSDGPALRRIHPRE